MVTRRAAPTLALLVSVLLPAPIARGADPSPSRLDEVIASALRAQAIPGAAVAVVRKGRTLLARGYGLANVELRVPVTASTRFMTGSIAKQFTAVAVLLLAEDGRLGLDEELGRYFPECTPRWRGVTVRQLLTHTSGMPDYEAMPPQEVPAAEAPFLAWAFGLAAEFEPGSRWAYSNTGYVLLGILVKRVSGVFYADFLAERVFRHLGMVGTRVISRSEIVPGRAAGYLRRERALVNEEWYAGDGGLLMTSADGSLYQSLDDLVRWDAAVRDRKVLSAASWREALTAVTLASGTTYPYGMAWFLDGVNGHGRNHHSGGFQGFTAQYARYPDDDLTVIVLTNLASANPVAVADAVAALFDRALSPRSTPVPGLAPEATARARRLLEEARAGELSPDELAHVRAGFFPGIAKGLKATLARFGRLERVEAVEERALGDDQEIRFRCTFERKIAELKLKVAPDGKVAEIQLWALPGP